MEEKDTVIVDVRNQYESAIGHFQPPPGGAELIDPMMRNSIEFPKWLADPETKKKLHNKVCVVFETVCSSYSLKSAYLTLFEFHNVYRKFSCIVPAESGANEPRRC